MNKNLNVIIGVELMCAAQGIEFREPLLTSPKLMRVMSIVRSEVPTLDQDRYMANDIASAAALVADGRLTTELAPNFVSSSL
jgi:histidine ammonia-lyase